ncbi:MAG: cytochrome c [Rubrivivax sp.]|nr:cytochrome c [Rubrivivax sp.]
MKVAPATAAPKRAAKPEAGLEATFEGIGRAATAAELAAWDIDVRPDFKGLPPGRGSAARGQVLWDAKCANCHGVFGESNEFFAPLVGGTTDADIALGRVTRLTDEAYPARTTMMKLAHLSTLWDTIRRAMPWDAPKSLSDDDVYALTAYLLHLAGVLPETFVLGEHNVRQVQQRLPNRDGLTTQHGLWPGTGIGPLRGAPRGPDVRARACMTRCLPGEPHVASSLPAHARGLHGNLAEQNRRVGAQRGIDTRGP